MAIPPRVAGANPILTEAQKKKSSNVNFRPKTMKEERLIKKYGNLQTGEKVEKEKRNAKKAQKYQDDKFSKVQSLEEYEKTYNEAPEEIKKYFKTPNEMKTIQDNQRTEELKKVDERISYAKEKKAKEEEYYRNKRKKWKKKKESYEKRGKGDYWQKRYDDIRDDEDEEEAYWDGYLKKLEWGKTELSSGKNYTYDSIHDYADDYGDYREDYEEAKNKNKRSVEKYQRENPNAVPIYKNKWSKTVIGFTDGGYVKGNPYLNSKEKLIKSDLNYVKNIEKKIHEGKIKNVDPYLKYTSQKFQDSVNYSKKGLIPVWGVEGNLKGFEDKVLNKVYSVDEYNSRYKAERAKLDIKYDSKNQNVTYVQPQVKAPVKEDVKVENISIEKEKKGFSVPITGMASASIGGGGVRIPVGDMARSAYSWLDNKVFRGRLPGGKTHEEVVLERNAEKLNKIKTDIKTNQSVSFTDPRDQAWMKNNTPNFKKIGAKMGDVFQGSLFGTWFNSKKVVEQGKEKEAAQDIKTSFNEVGNIMVGDISQNKIVSVDGNQIQPQQSSFARYSKRMINPIERFRQTYPLTMQAVQLHQESKENDGKNKRGGQGTTAGDVALVALGETFMRNPLGALIYQGEVKNEEWSREANQLKHNQLVDAARIEMGVENIEMKVKEVEQDPSKYNAVQSSIQKEIDGLKRKGINVSLTEEGNYEFKSPTMNKTITSTSAILHKDFKTEEGKWSAKNYAYYGLDLAREVVIGIGTFGAMKMTGAIKPITMLFQKAGATASIATTGFVAAGMYGSYMKGVKNYEAVGMSGSEGGLMNLGRFAARTSGFIYSANPRIVRSSYEKLPYRVRYQKVQFKTKAGKTDTYRLFGFEKGSQGKVLASHHNGKIKFGTPKTDLKKYDLSGGLNPESPTFTKFILKNLRSISTKDLHKAKSMTKIMKATEFQKSIYRTNFPKTTKTLNEAGTKEVLKFAKKHGAQTYGTFAAKAQSPKKLKGYKLREPNDIDLQLSIGQTKSEKLAKDLVKALNKAGNHARISSQSKTLIETKAPDGTWHHAVDIHSADMAAASGSMSDGAAQYRSFGFKLDQGNINVQGIKTMKLSEQGVRKGVSSMTVWNDGVRPKAHRVKDIGDFITTQEILIESAKASGKNVAGAKAALNAYKGLTDKQVLNSILESKISLPLLSPSITGASISASQSAAVSSLSVMPSVSITQSSSASLPSISKAVRIPVVLDASSPSVKKKSPSASSPSSQSIPSLSSPSFPSSPSISSPSSPSASSPSSPSIPSLSSPSFPSSPSISSPSSPSASSPSSPSSSSPSSPSISSPSIPIIDISPPNISRKSRGSLKGGSDVGFDAYAKENGKYKKLNSKPLKTEAEARKLAAFVVDHTLSASGKVEKRTGVKEFQTLKKRPSVQSFKFRDYKIRKGKTQFMENEFIERKQFRLDRASETKSIQSFKKSKNFMSLFAKPKKKKKVTSKRRAKKK